MKALLFAGVVCVLKYATPSMVWFVFLSLLCACAYPVLHLQWFRDPVYRALSFDRKMYVVSNTIKGYTLAVCSPIAVFLLYECLHGVWNTRRILVLGHIYAVLDAVSLCMVERMQVSTVVHHLAVVLVHAQNCLQDFEEDTYARCSVIYAIFSCFAFQVNLQLARRFDQPHFHSAYVVYILCCGFNWAWQLWYALTHPVSTLGVLWWLFMAAIVYDDVHLIRWLHAQL